MESFAELFGLTSPELIQLATAGIVLLIGLFVVRTVFKLTATLLRVGCFGIVLIVGLLFFMRVIN